MAALNSQAGQLGFPKSDELPNRDPGGVGRHQEFQGGLLYWHPTRSHGAHPISGEFAVTWGKSDYEMRALGYLVSDGLPNSDGIGRRQDFEGGTTIGHSTRSNGIHAVMVKIHQSGGATARRRATTAIRSPTKSRKATLTARCSSEAKSSGTMAIQAYR